MQGNKGAHIRAIIKNSPNVYLYTGYVSKQLILAIMVKKKLVQSFVFLSFRPYPTATSFIVFWEKNIPAYYSFSEPPFNLISSNSKFSHKSDPTMAA